MKRPIKKRNGKFSYLSSYVNWEIKNGYLYYNWIKGKKRGTIELKEEFKNNLPTDIVYQNIKFHIKHNL